MIPELGHLALAIALALALLLSALPLAGALGRADWWRPARRLAVAQGLFVVLGCAALVACLANNDFSVAYVVAHSNSQLPLPFRVAAAWGGHEGSILLWILLLAGWTVAVAAFSRHMPAPTVARVLAVMGAIAVGFLLFLLLTSNPFARTWPAAAADGRDLNPVLQDPGMIAHPPILYMGYVGYSVVFAFAIAALAEGRFDAAWARWLRPWTLLAWSFLTLGIVLGSAWAYYVLGWGGWWFWDAVENASLMPWLVGTALLHSLAVAEKRATFKNWTLLLAIVAFSLSLLGTFLVRSGVLTSIHAFASDPRRGVYILVFLAVVIGGALLLYAWRAPSIAAGKPFGWWSRESLLLVNNLLLMTAAGTVLLGTLYPLLLDALGGGKISVGPPYFDTVFVPLMAPMLVLLAIGPLLSWKQASWGTVWSQLRWIAVGAVVFAAAVGFAWQTSPMVAAGVGFGAWIGAAVVAGTVRRLRQRPPGWSWVRQARSVPGSYWGMQLAHAGMAVFVVGVTLANGLETVADRRMAVGDETRLGAHRVRFVGLSKVQGPNYVAARARFEFDRGGAVEQVLFPEKRFYPVSQMPTTDAAIDRGFTRDLYVSLAEARDDGAWIVRLQIKPFMNWIWAGAVLIALGGGFAAADRRYRRATASPASAEPSSVLPLSLPGQPA